MASMSDEENAKLMQGCESLKAMLEAGNIRARTDLRDNYSAGWKFNHWELKVLYSLSLYFVFSSYREKKCQNKLRI